MNIRRSAGLACFFSLMLLGGVPAQDPATPPAQPPQPEPLKVLAPTTISDAPVEQMLPGHAILHARVNNLRDLILTVEKLALKAIPVKSVPPQMRPFFDQPSPLLALLGMQMEIEGFNIETVQQISGFQLDQPVTLTTYAGDPQKDVIFSIPVADYKTASGMLMKLLGVDKTEVCDFEMTKGLKVRSRNRDLPRTLYVAGSPKRIFVSGSKHLIDLVGTNEDQGRRPVPKTPQAGSMASLIGPSRDSRLAGDPAIVRGLADHARSDVTLTLSAQAFKQIIGIFHQKYGRLPAPMIENWKRQAREGLDERQLAEIEGQLQQKLGVADFDQFMDLVECYGLPTYNILVDALATELKMFHGLVFSLDIGADFQKFDVTLYSDSIDPAGSKQALDLAAVGKALSKLPAEHGIVSVHGRTPHDLTTPAYDKWLADVRGRLVEKKLPTAMIDLLDEIKKQHRAEIPLDSLMPWRLETTVSRSDMTDLERFKSVQEYVDAFKDPEAFIGDARVSMFPGDALDSVGRHFESWKEARESELQSQKKLNRFLDQDQNWLFKKIRLKNGEHGGLRKWTLEEAYITNGGIFGHHQHELINRRMYYATTRDGLTFLESHTTDQPWLTKPVAGTGVSKALQNVLAQAPKGAGGLCIVDKKMVVLSIAEYLSQFEDLVHRDLNNYLATVRGIREKAVDDDDLNEKLLKLDVPLPMQSLNQDETGAFYCVLPGNLMFPRPKLTPHLMELLADYAVKDDELGGSAAFETVAKGRFSLTVVQNTEAITHLIKTTGDKFVELYRDKETGIPEFMAKAMLEADGSPAMTEESVIINTIWSFLGDLQ